MDDGAGLVANVFAASVLNALMGREVVAYPAVKLALVGVGRAFVVDD